MGALIMTKGTKRLAAHYNEEFDTWIRFYATTELDKFNRNGADIDIWDDIIQKITDTDADHTKRNDKRTLLPPDHAKHAHLHARWRYFLKKVLNQTNQNKLADAIYKSLKPPANNAYIIFDVVPGGASDVTLTNGMDDGNPIARINIVTTGPLRTTPHTPGGDDPPPID